MTDENRKAFENWATHCDYPFEFTSYDEDDDYYFETDTYVAWLVWRFRDLEVEALKARVADRETRIVELHWALHKKSESLNDVSRQFTRYLELGGFFNPEAMDHQKVRDMIISARKAIDAALGEQR